MSEIQRKTIALILMAIPFFYYQIKSMKNVCLIDIPILMMWCVGVFIL